MSCLPFATSKCRSPIIPACPKLNARCAPTVACEPEVNDMHQAAVTAHHSITAPYRLYPFSAMHLLIARHRLRPHPTAAILRPSALPNLRRRLTDRYCEIAESICAMRRPIMQRFFRSLSGIFMDFVLIMSQCLQTVGSFSCIKPAAIKQGSGGVNPIRHANIRNNLDAAAARFRLLPDCLFCGELF
jgi:hypothetical protein